MYQICVSAATKGKSIDEGKEMAIEAGRVIAKSGHALLSGATVGLPHMAAIGYKEAGGKMCVGISPATSKVEHVMKYRLPTESYDTILYSGMHYIGRDVLLINSADAVISIGGRIGTLHEFTIALETDTPIGFIQDTGGIGEEILDILHAAGRKPTESIVFGATAQEVLDKLLDVLHKRHKKYAHLYK